MIRYKITNKLPYLGGKHILVTGLHRSGTTFIGTVLAEAKKAGYVYELCNPDHGHYVDHVTHTCAICKLKLINYPYITKGSSFEKKYFRHIKHHLNMRAISRKISISKDPFILFSSEWYEKKFNAEILITSRNPLSYVSSIKRINWPFDFSDILNQKDLVDTYFPEYIELIERYVDKEKSLIKQATLLWNLGAKYVIEMQKQHTEWHFLKHEEFAENPMQNFESLFNDLNLEYNDSIKSYIDEITNKNNPKESNPKRTHSLVRDSKATIDTWKERLTDLEVNWVLDNTVELGKELYPELY